MGWWPLVPVQVSAADLQTIRKRGQLIVAVKDNLRPLGFRGVQGQIEGLEIDLAQRLAIELLGRSDAVKLRPVLNHQRFSAVLNDEVDIAIAHITLTPSRLRILRCSRPYYTDGTALITNDPAIQTLSHLMGKPIVVLNNSTTVETLRRHLPSAKLLGVNSYESAKELLEQKKALSFAADASVLSGWIQELPQYRLLLPTLSSEFLCVALPKGQQYDELKQEIDQIITRLETSGWLRERALYWGLPVK